MARRTELFLWTLGLILFLGTFLSMYNRLIRTKNIVTPNDLAWSFDNPNNKMICNGFHVLDRCTLEKMQTLIQKRYIDQFPRLKCYVQRNSLGIAIWKEDDHFDLNKHCFNVSINADQEWSESDLQEYMGTIYARPFEANRPPLEFIFVPQYRNNQSVLIARFSHVLADGVGFLGMLLNAADKEEIEAEPEVEKKVKPMSMLSQCMALLQIPLIPYYWIRVLTMKPDENFLHQPKLSGERLTTWGELIPLQDVKLIKNSLSCSVNDVILACVAGALRRYFDSKGQAPQNLHTALPVSLRSRAEYRNIKPYNKISVVTVKLPLEATGQDERLKQTKRAVDAIKNSMEPMGNYWGLFATNWISEKLQKFCMQLGASKATMVLSNVPGPQKKMVLMGATVHELGFFVPQMGTVGLGISVASYAQSVRIGINSDKAICADPKTIADYFAQEMHVFLLRAKEK